MKCVRCVFTVLLLLLLLINGGVEASAMNTGFSTESLPEDDIDIFLKNVNISILSDEPQKKAIDCFAVSEKGMIAIGCSDSKNKTVCIYTNDGNFQYGYSFECNGNFGIDLDENILNIYFVRSDIAIAVNPMGEVENILKIKNTSENNAYWNNCVFLNSRKIGNTEYSLKNDMGLLNIFASSYSQLIITNINGEESIMYDVSSAQFSNVIAVLIAVIIFICIVVAVVVWQFIKLKHNILST